jgi:hypothetical protein
LRITNRWSLFFLLRGRNFFFDGATFQFWRKIAFQGMMTRSEGQSQNIRGREEEGVCRFQRRILRDLFLNISHGLVIIQPILGGAR